MAGETTLRTTLVREPNLFLAAQYFWHHIKKFMPFRYRKYMSYLFLKAKKLCCYRKMRYPMEYQNLLVFLEFPGPSSPSLGLLKALSYMDVTLVGFHSLPDGDKLGADRRASTESTLEEIAAEFEERGIRVTQHVATGESMVETRNEWASRDGIDAVLTPGGVNTVGRILVGVRDTRNIEKLADCVDLIDRERIIHIKLLHIAPESGSEDTATDRETVTGREALEITKSKLANRGVNPAAIHLQMNVSDTPDRELVSAARKYDLTVLGKTQEIGFEERVFGPISNRIVDRANSTVLIPT